MNSDWVRRRIVEAPEKLNSYVGAPIRTFSSLSPEQIIRLTQWAKIVDPGSNAADQHQRIAKLLEDGRTLRRRRAGGSPGRIMRLGDIEMPYSDPCNRIFGRSFKGAYEPELTAFLQRRIVRGSTFVDVGANVGYFSLLAARRGATVFAIEMQLALIPTILLNACHNDLWTIHAWGLAISDATGTALTYRKIPSMGHRIHSELAVRDDFPLTSVNHDCVPMTTLDNLFDAPPEIVKIDVEGAEIGVLSGARALISKRRTMFIVELHPRQITEFDRDIGELATLFPAESWDRRLLGGDPLSDREIAALADGLDRPQSHLIATPL